MKLIAPPPPEAPADPFAMLTPLLTKPELRNVWYSKKTFTIDGYRFVDCRFDACQLYVNSPEFELERCLVSPDTTFVYGMSLVKVVQLFFSRLTELDHRYPEFVPVRHSDGTITIKRG